MVIVESLYEEWKEMNRDFSHFKEVEKIIENYKMLIDLRNQLQKAKKGHDLKKTHSIDIDIFLHGPGIFIPLDMGILEKYQESKFTSYYHTFIEDLLHSDVYEYKNFYNFYIACTRYYTALKILIKTLKDFYDISEKINAIFQEIESKDEYHKNMIYHDKISLALKHKNEGVRRDILTYYKDMKEAEKKMKIFFEE